MMKLQLSGKRNNYTPYRSLSSRTKQDGKGKGNGYSRTGGQASTRQKNRQQQPRPNRQISLRQGDNKAGSSNPTEGAPGEQVWVDNVETVAKAKTLSGRILLRSRSAYASTRNERKLSTVNNHGTIIRTGITCKKIPCYMRDSTSWWLIVENGKIFRSYVKHF